MLGVGSDDSEHLKAFSVDVDPEGSSLPDYYWFGMRDYSMTNSHELLL